MMAFILKCNWGACLTVVLGLLLVSGCGSEGDITSPHLTVNLPSSPTNQSPLTLSGKVEEGATVQVSVAPLPKTVGPVVIVGDGDEWTCELVFTDSPGTNYSVSVSALDQRENRSTISPFNVFFDNTAEITLDQFVSPVPPGTEQVLAGTFEPGATLDIEIDGVPIGSERIFINVNTWRADLPVLVAGAQLTVKAADVLGNTKEIPQEIAVSNTAIPLTITATSPTNLVEQLVTVASSNELATFQVELARGSAGAVPVPGTPNYLLTGLAQGRNVLTVTATAAGSTQTVASRLLFVDQSRPVVSMGENGPALVQIAFSEAVQGVSDTTFVLRDAATGNAVPGEVSYDQAAKRASFVPASALAYATTYRVELLAAVTGSEAPFIADLAGNSIQPNSGNLWVSSPIVLLAPSATVSQ
jgi:hypothetical protein